MIDIPRAFNPEKWRQRGLNAAMARLKEGPATESELMGVAMKAAHGQVHPTVMRYAVQDLMETMGSD